MKKPSRTRWWVSAVAAAMIAATLTPSASADDPDPDVPITDPITEEPKPANFGLVLEEVAQFPKTEPTPAPTDPRLMRHARLNYLGQVPDDSGRLYVPDLNGPLYLMENDQPREYLNLRTEFSDFFSGRGMGSGFGFVTFHPEFADNGIFYTVHTENQHAIDTKPPTYPNQPKAFVQSVITEWTADDPAADTFAGSKRELFRFGFSQQIHAIQQIDFNPTAQPGDEDYGLLYLAVGDGGIGVSSDVPQDLSTPAGKILRIDPLGSDGPNGEYGIPDSNPFVDEEGALGEIYAVGMRDPHRFSWDTGGKNRMYLGHIGQHAIEAVYDVRAGDNFGWPVIEGRLAYRNQNQCYLYPLTEEMEDAGYVYPVASYDHNPPANWPCNSDSGKAISGGLVHRGDLNRLRGKYVFGDLVDGRVFYTDPAQMRRGAKKEATMHELALFDSEGTRMRMTDFVDDGRVDLRFGTDAEQNLYLITKADGKVWRVTDTRSANTRGQVVPSLERDLVSSYDFEHPFAADDAKETDQGASRTLIDLVNGAEQMRVDDGAHPGSNNALQLRSADPATGQKAWKAGVYSADADGVESLSRFSGAEGITVMGWFKMTGENPSLNTNTPAPDDRYNAVGLAGVLSGNSDGHGVRALLELIEVEGELRLVALGRRLDTGSSQTFAASEDWRTLLPDDEWVHLAATFDYTTGEMALYRNGKPVRGEYTSAGDPWQVDGTGASKTNPRGLKIGGSFPQDGSERNPCNCRMDSLMFFDSALSRGKVQAQSNWFGRLG